MVPLSAAAMALVLLGAALMASRPEEGRVPTTGPPTTTVPTLQLPSGPGTLAPGTYASSVYRPTVHLSVGEGWRLAHQKENNISLQPSEDPDEALRILSITRVTHVLSPERTYTREEAFAATSAEPVPENLVGWFQAHKRLSVSAPRAVTVGDRPAEMLEVSVEAGYRTNACADASTSSCVIVFPVDGKTHFWLRTQSTYHMYFLRTGADWVVLTVEAPSDVFASFRDQVTPVIDSVRVP